MLENFEDIIDIVLRAEGGYVNHKYDRGGKTKYGITQKAYPKEDIENLTVERAKLLYKRDYWDKYKVGEYPAYLRHIVFDMIVNHGFRTYSYIMQKAVVEYTNSYIKIDGYAGSKTIEAIKNIKETRGFIYAVRLSRIAMYESIVSRDRTQQVFLLGWIRRGLKV